MRLGKRTGIWIPWLPLVLMAVAGPALRSAYPAPPPTTSSAQVDNNDKTDALNQQSLTAQLDADLNYWKQHEKTISAIRILAIVVALSYAVKLGVWLTQRLFTLLGTLLGPKRFSVKRAGTLASFAGSIIKLFVWIFGVVAVLNVFGVDPATSAGAIGLIGLIMAGMFQQIVVDFVKGLDIIAGRHYNVGDFIEVAGKLGHVVDFNIKHTRIRTPSGQEYNIPNSQCVPSRRFPDGYVDNYVDFTLKTVDDEGRAKSAIEPLCHDLNQRIEPVRETPTLTERFTSLQEQVTLRYRVRVLPGCGWVISDYFIPAVKQALAREKIKLAGEPSYYFINHIETFRKLFSRRLTEREILRQSDG